MRTVWDVLTSLGPGTRVIRPHHASHVLVLLPNGWRVGLTVGPAPASELGQRLAGRNVSAADPFGREGSPEGWFDRTPDAEVAIVHPSGAWFHRTDRLLSDIGAIQVWPYLSAKEIATLMARDSTQPAGCVCPDCHPPE
jgi:hypothetical protein